MLKFIAWSLRTSGHERRGTNKDGNNDERDSEVKARMCRPEVLMPLNPLERNEKDSRVVVF